MSPGFSPDARSKDTESNRPATRDDPIWRMADGRKGREQRGRKRGHVCQRHNFQSDTGTSKSVILCQFGRNISLKKY